MATRSGVHGRGCSMLERERRCRGTRLALVDTKFDTRGNTGNGEEMGKETERTHLVPTRAQKRTFRRDFGPSRILTSTEGSERASRKARRLPMMADSKRAFDFAAGNFGLGGGEGIVGPSGLSRREWSGAPESWTSWVATTRGIG